MRILVLGAGAIGGYFGARLLQHGVDVSFLVRPARAATLAATGLRVHSGRGDFNAAVAALTTVDAAYDLVIVSCKAYDLDAAITAIAPAVGPHTRVLPLLNGLRHLDALDAAFGATRVLGGLAHISVTLDANGAIEHLGKLEWLTFGSRGRDAPVPAAVRGALMALGPQAIESADIIAAMWDKFAFISTLAGITCLLRANVGQILATADGATLIRRLHGECLAVAAGSGHALPPQLVAAADTILGTPGSPLKASMLRDLERGARTEGEHILGDMHARATALGIDAPLLAAALAHVRVYEASRAAA